MIADITDCITKFNFIFSCIKIKNIKCPRYIVIFIIKRCKCSVMIKNEKRLRSVTCWKGDKNKKNVTAPVQKSCNRTTDRNVNSSQCKRGDRAHTGTRTTR